MNNEGNNLSIFQRLAVWWSPPLQPFPPSSEVQIFLDYWQRIYQSGEEQKRFFAVTRTIIEIAAISCCPAVAITGAIVGMFAQEHACKVVNFVDDTITTLWNKMSFERKIGVSVIALIGLGMNFSVILLPASILSAKFGAEISLSNSNKQE